jgi:hypothetical protein
MISERPKSVNAPPNRMIGAVTLTFDPGAGSVDDHPNDSRRILRERW